MRILWVSDIHLNLNKNIEWETNRYNKLFDILVDVSDTVDLTILGGDIFDNPQPSLKELNLFYTNLRKFKNPVTIISGNHENIDKTLSTFNLIPELYFEYVDYKILSTKKTDIYLCSHKNLKDLYGIRRELKDKQNLLLTHVRCSVPPHIKEEVDCKFLASAFDLVISGDIHFKYSPFDNFHYAGQPYSTTYKQEVSNGYFIIDTDTLDFEYQELHLPSKIKYEVPIDGLKKLQLSDNNLYKIRVSGGIEELQDLPKDNGNVTYEKIVITNESTEDKEALNVTDGRLNIIEVLMDTVKETYGLGEDLMETGRGLIDGISSKYTR